jgi:hypothetical protein
MQGHITHSEQQTRHSRLNEVGYKEKIAVTFETEFICMYTHIKCLLIQLQLILVLDNPDQNMKNEKCYSQLSTYFKKTHGI